MKDYSQIKATLTVLEEVQKSLNSNLENCKEYLQEYTEETKLFIKEKDEEGYTRYYRMTDGEKVDCTQWDWEYKQERVSDSKRQIKAYEAVLNHLENFKL